MRHFLLGVIFYIYLIYNLFKNYKAKALDSKTRLRLESKALGMNTK
ncbi:hypothetical protein BGP_4514 [Beggiatoa sp. PS]|nr:hypothetical protein BGP_4514 [Beggiatoa sp. PS]